MRDVDSELKALRLHGMASAWADLVAQGTLSSLESSRWLIEHRCRPRPPIASCARSATR